jgi:hypothetical protein
MNQQILNTIFNKYVIPDISKLILEYDQCYVQEVLHIINNNYNKFAVINSTKINLGYIDIYLICNNHLINIYYNVISRIIVKYVYLIITEYKNECNDIMKSTKFYPLPNFFCNNQKIYTDITLNEFMNTIFNLIKEYFVESYNILFSFNYKNKQQIDISQIQHKIAHFFNINQYIVSRYTYEFNESESFFTVSIQNNQNNIF